MASERSGKRTIYTNPDEPRTGDNAFSFYDASKPVGGNAQEVARLRSELRGLRGETVVVHVNGRRIDPDTNRERVFHVRREIRYRNYNDIFGSGSVYHAAIKAVRNRHSDQQLLIDSITIEAA